MNKNFSAKFLVSFIVLLNFIPLSVDAKNINNIKNFQIQNRNLKLVNNNPNISNQLTQLENKILKSTYTFDPLEKRLDRLELEVFGDTNSDYGHEDRLSRLIASTGFNYNNPSMNENLSSQSNEKLPNTNYEKEDSSVSYPMVDTLEKEVFNRSFTNDDIYYRLSRLEKEVYKKTSENLPLSDRIDTLKGSILNQNPVYSYNDNNDENYYSNDRDDMHIPGYYGKQAPLPYKGHQTGNGSSSIDPYLAQLESQILKSNFSNESPDVRLSRLENKMFNKSFSSDSDVERLDRLMAVSEAKSNSSIFDNNKLMRGLSAGVQIGGIILMILAMIL